MTICALIFPDLCTQRDDERVFSLITHVSFFEIRADIPRVRVRISHDTVYGLSNRMLCKEYGQNKRKHERDDVYHKWNRWHGDLGVFRGFRK